MRKNKEPIINCHTHVFRGGHVPPFLFKTLLNFPFYYLFSTRIIVGYFTWEQNRSRSKYKPRSIRRRRLITKWRIVFQNNESIKLFRLAVDLAIFIMFVQILLDAIFKVEYDNSLWNQLVEVMNSIFNFLPFSKALEQWLIVVLAFLVVKPLRFVVKGILSRTKDLIFGQQSKNLLESYRMMARYTTYTSQATIFSFLEKQYPDDTLFIVLPMDMEYMKAGKLRKTNKYYEQLKELKEIKQRGKHKSMLPFLFIDPRRIVDDPNFFVYRLEDGLVVLEECIVKEYVEENGFRGFKIYPALGYYPFEDALLPLWLYAVQHNLPIMTHCIKGSVYYRGSKHPDWDAHPVFKEFTGVEGKYAALFLPEKSNSDFQLNFTHPMNYLILLDEELLRHLISSRNESFKQLFGFTDMEKPLKRNLSTLKICFAHFGGAEHWRQYMNQDRASVINVFSHSGFQSDIIRTREQQLSWIKLEQNWKNTDWFSLICYMLLNYDNTYADISYILFDPEIYGLLRIVMSNPNLRTKVLYGTDFYVVRNHGNEKQLLSIVKDNLTDEDFDQIARINPKYYI